jgi:hypothetical protein
MPNPRLPFLTESQNAEYEKALPEEVPPCRVCGQQMQRNDELNSAFDFYSWHCIEGHSHRLQRRGSPALVHALEELNREREEHAEMKLMFTEMSTSFQNAAAMLDDEREQHAATNQEFKTAAADFVEEMKAVRERALSAERELEQVKSALVTAVEFAEELGDYPDPYFQRKYKYPERRASLRALLLSLTNVAVTNEEVESGTDDGREKDN